MLKLGLRLGLSPTTGAATAPAAPDPTSEIIAAARWYHNWRTADKFKGLLKAGGAATQTGDAVLSSTPQKASWASGAGYINAVSNESSDPTIQADGTVRMISTLCRLQTVDADGNAANPALITAGVYWVCKGVKPLRSGAGSNVQNWDSSNQMVLNFTDPGDGSTDIIIDLDLASGSHDTTSIKKNVTDNTEHLVTFFSDGTKLYVIWDDDEEIITEANKTLDPLGSSAILIQDAVGSHEQGLALDVAGSAVPEGYTSDEWWEVLKAHHALRFAEIPA